MLVRSCAALALVATEVAVRRSWNHLRRIVIRTIRSAGIELSDIFENRVPRVEILRLQECVFLL